MKFRYQGCPTTGRSGLKLAKRYGAENIDALAGSLAEEATVIDFGAGWSDFGQKVASSRPDIQWINVDMRYDLQRKAKRLKRKAAQNLQFVSANIFDIKPGDLPEADQIFSCAMVSHFTLDSDELAAAAVHTMASMLKLGGSIAIADFSDVVASFSADDYGVAPSLCVDATVEAMKLARGEYAFQIYSNLIGNVVHRVVDR